MLGFVSCQGRKACLQSSQCLDLPLLLSCADGKFAANLPAPSSSQGAAHPMHIIAKQSQTIMLHCSFAHAESGKALHMKHFVAASLPG